MSKLATPFSPLFRSDTYRALLFLAASVPIGAVALGLLIAGWVASGVLLITPLVVVVLIGFRGGVGLLAAADAALARLLLGAAARPRRAPGAAGYWRRGLAVVADSAFWNQQAYLALRLTVGFALAVGEFSLIAASLASLTYPITYRWSSLHLGSWQVDTFARSLVLVPAGIVGLVAAGWFARLLGRASRRVVDALLAGGESETHAPMSREARRWALGVHAAVSAGIGALLVLVWALTGGGYFWPEWALLPLALVLSVHAWIELVLERPGVRAGQSVAFAIQLGVSVELLAFFVLVWALTVARLLLAGLARPRLRSRPGGTCRDCVGDARQPTCPACRHARVDAGRRGRRARGRAAPHRARSARRCAGTARCARHEPRARGAEVRVRSRRRATARGRSTSGSR